MPEEPGEPVGTDDVDDDEYEDEEAVTELALSWLAEQDRPGGKRSLEDMVVRVDVSSATAARDRALQEHMERQEMLKKAQVTAPWAQKKLTVGQPFSTRRSPLRDQPSGRPTKKKAKKKKKEKVLAKKAPAKRAVAKVAKGAKGAKKVAKPPKNATAKRTAPVIEVADLPIEDYDRLTVEQIVAVLDDLEDDDLDLVAEYEEQHRNRDEILDAIDDLFEDQTGPSGDAATTRAAADDLPIEDYDRLTAEQIVAVLDDLEDDDLDLVAEYEERHRNRSQILDAIDDLFEEGPAPSAEKSPAPKITAKKITAKKISAKKTPAKKTPAKKIGAKKAPAKKAPAGKAGAKKSPAKTTVKTTVKKAPAARS